MIAFAFYLFHPCTNSDRTFVVAFLQYPYDAEAKCHKGFAFVLLNYNEDVRVCLAKNSRSWFYVEGAPSQGGFDSRGRAYLRIRPAHVEMARAKEEDTHLILQPEIASAASSVSAIGLRDFKVMIEDVMRSMGVDIVKSEGELSGHNKLVHLHTRDAESAAVVKMFVNNFKEKDVLVKVRFAKKSKASKPAPVLADAQQPATVKAVEKLVLEPITENYGRFGISYSAAVKSTASPAPALAPTPARAVAPSAPVHKMATSSKQALPVKGKAVAGKHSTKVTQLAGTA